jgi:2-oxoisovalerate ferredoxin oxidoreductase alpha subunit
MLKTIVETGNHIAGLAALAARAQVVAAYPITPQTQIVEKIAGLVDSAKMNAEYICVESEHSAMSACIGASTVGARTFTATSAHGLAYMHEMLHWASAARLPIVMAVVNRAMGPPWTIWTDHGDSLPQRDTGWIQVYCASNQEIFDSIIQAYRVCEDQRVLMPAMICLEGFILSHTSTPIKIPDQKEIDDFLPPFKPGWILDVENPVSHGNIVSPEYYMELRYYMHEALEKAKQLIPEVASEYSEKLGLPNYGGLIEEYMCDDAEVILVSMGTIGSEAKLAVEKLRDEGYKVGSARIRVFRPFPREAVREIATRAKALAIIDRDISFGMEGILFTEVRSTLFDLLKKPLTKNFIAGLGGRDVTQSDIEQIAKKTFRTLETGAGVEGIDWVNLRR